MLVLEQCIPWKPEDRCLQLYDADLASELTGAWLPPLVTSTSCIPNLHDATRFGLAMCPLISRHEFEAVKGLHLYTDGSGGTGGSQATWGFCVIALLADGSLRYVGTQAGRLTAAREHHHWIGCDYEDSMAAELSAVFWALAWAIVLAARLLHLCAVTFHYDNLPVGSAIFHGWTLERDTSAQALAVALRQVLETIVVTSGEHIHSHQGHPWNEMADICCAAVRPDDAEYTTSCTADAIDYSVVRRLAADGAHRAQWLYIHFLPPAARTAFPVDHEGWITRQRLKPDWSQATPAADIAQHIDQYVQPGQATHGPKPKPKPILVATYNALTLRTKRQRDNLSRQLTERRAHICGVQESRGKHDCTTNVGDYIVFGSASLGKYGCQVWISTTLPFATLRGKAVRLTESDLAVVYSTPRAIMVRSSSPGLQALIVSAHAPHHGHTTAELKQWWSETKAAIKQHAGDLPVLMAVDANADIALHDAGGKQYHAVPHIRELCGETNLRVPTLDDPDAWAADAQRTTFEKEDVAYTIDFIFATADFQTMPGTATAWHDFDTNGFQDHLPTSIKVLPPTAATAAGARRRVPAYDRAAAQHPTPLQAQDLAQRLANPPVIPCWIDTTSHQYALDQWLQEVLTDVFPKQKKPPRAPELSPGTCALYNARARIRAKARALGKSISKQTFKTTFAHWKRAHQTNNTRHFPNPPGPTAWSQVRGFASRTDCVNAALLHLVAADIDEMAAAEEAKDRALDTETRNDELVAAIDGNDVTKMYSMTRRITVARCPRVSPSILDEDGRIVHGHVQTKQRWRRHFASLMDGQATSLEQVIESSRARERDHNVNLHLEVVPTNADRARRMRKFRLKTGIGEDRVGAEILRLNAGCMSNNMAAITLKTCMQIDVPVQSKGGHIFELYKNKGSRLDCGNFRDITLGHITSKPFAASMRNKAYQAFRGKALDTQFGALRARGTDFAHLSMRASYDFAAATSQAIGGIFVDVEKAFARLCRALVLPAPASDEIFVNRLLACGLSEKIISSILDKARSFDAWDAAGGNTHLQAMLSEMHSETWASCEYLPQVIALSGGTLAGNALGDLVFTASMAVLLTDLRAELLSEDLITRYTAVRDCFSGDPLAHTSTDALAVETSYVDDTFIPVFAPTAIIAPQNVRHHGDRRQGFPEARICNKLQQREDRGGCFGARPRDRCA